MLSSNKSNQNRRHYVIPHVKKDVYIPTLQKKQKLPRTEKVGSEELLFNRYQVSGVIKRFER